MFSFRKNKPIKRVYGWKPQVPDRRDIAYAPAIMAIEELPRQYDLRKDMPPIVDQGQTGCCTGCAWAAAVSYKINKLEFSPMFIYYNERVLEGTIRTDSGAYIRDGGKALVKYGASEEIFWPMRNKFRTKPSKNAYLDASNHRINKYMALSDMDTMIRAIAQNNTVVFGISVYESFESEEVARTGNVPVPKDTESNLGGHAIIAVGYDLDKQVILCRNSWGKEWGDSGYFRLPMEFFNLGLASDFWIIN